MRAGLAAIIPSQPERLAKRACCCTSLWFTVRLCHPSFNFDRDSKSRVWATRQTFSKRLACPEKIRRIVVTSSFQRSASSLGSMCCSNGSALANARRVPRTGRSLVRAVASIYLEPLAPAFNVLMEVACLDHGEIGLGQYARELLDRRVTPHPQVPKNTCRAADRIAYTALDQESSFRFSNLSSAVEAPPIRPANLIHFTYLPG